MSTSREVTVWCDHCGDWTYGTGGPCRTVVEARKSAIKVGWVRRDGRDLCPRCKVDENRPIEGRVEG